MNRFDPIKRPARSTLSAIMLAATLLVVTPASADPPRQATSPATQASTWSGPFLGSVHPAIVASFQLLVSLTALLAFPARD